MKINKFWNLHSYIEFSTPDDISIFNEVVLNEDRKFGKNNGLYELLNGNLIAIFSYEGKNYLYLKDHAEALTGAVTIECFIAQAQDAESWLKVYDKGDLIFEITYLNPHEPFVEPFGFPHEDY